MTDYRQFFYENRDAHINKDIVLTDEQKFWKEHSYRRYQLMKWSRQQNNRELKWDQWQRQYEAWRPSKSLDDWQSNIVPPFTTSVVESALSEMIDQTLQPQIRARTRKFVAAATVMQYVNKYAWEIGYGDVELYKAIKQGLILGSTAWQDYYWREDRVVKDIVSYDPKTGREKYKEVVITDFDDVYGEAVNMWDLFVDPAARTMNIGPYKASDAIRRYIFHIDTFHKLFGGTKWDKYNVVRKIRPGGDARYYQYYQPPQGIDHGNYVEVLWHWIRNPDILHICANDVPFYIGPNPYRHKMLPFGIGQDIMDPWSIYGKGQPGLLESIQDELTTMRRMRLDRQKLDIFKMVFISGQETVTEGDLIPAPMKPVYVEDVNNIKAFEYGDINPSAYREEMLLKEDGVRVTGIDDRAQSVTPRGSTATEAAILKEATQKRLRMKIWLLARTLLREQIELRTSNIIQYYSQPKIVEIMGENALEKQIKMREAMMGGRLLQDKGKLYEAQYRTIVTRNKRIRRTNDVEEGIVIEENRGDNFFMVTPDLLPKTVAAFQFVQSAEPTLPLSKPLMQQKIAELFQHPIIVAAIQNGHYDINKIADKMVDLSEFDPQDFYAGPTDSDKINQTLANPQQMIEKASKENELLMSGEKLIGTPFATPEHTQMHLEFMKSTNFKEKANPQIITNFVRHILEENVAQSLRGTGMPPQIGGGQQPPGGQGSMRSAETAGIMGGDAKAMNPNMQLGPENVPDMTGAQSRPSVSMMN